MKKASLYMTASIFMLVVISTNIRAVEASQASGCGISLKSTEYSVVFASAFATENSVTCRCSKAAWFPFIGPDQCLASYGGNVCASGVPLCQQFNTNCGGTYP